MTWNISNRIGAYLGWCPDIRILNAPEPCSGGRTDSMGIPDHDPPKPGTSPSVLEGPQWMTFVAIGILFATFFAGGNLWWVAFVFTVLVIFVLIRIRALQSSPGA